jgi:hypothetical protein
VTTSSTHQSRPSSVHQKLQEFHGGIIKGERRSIASRKQQQEKSEAKKSDATNTATTGHKKKRILTAYLEPTDTLVINARDTEEYPTIPLPIRNTTAALLQTVEFPQVSSCQTLMQDFPIDDYPRQDPFLPWIHDYFPSTDGHYIRFVAQNRRRCDTGEDHQEDMKFWEPQIALFQPIPVVAYNNNGTYRLASSVEEATHKATRFQCRFHHPHEDDPTTTEEETSSITTLSVYPFDYEYVTWRKQSQPMVDRKGKDMSMFWLSQLLFSCPVPPVFQKELLTPSSSGSGGANNDNNPALYLDLIPIRTPVRTKRVLLTPDHTGKGPYASIPILNATKHFGSHHVLPNMDDAGRWANLPICRRKPEEIQPMTIKARTTTTTTTTAKEIEIRNEVPPTTNINGAAAEDEDEEETPYRLVACTWTSASYTRRGDVVRVSDSAQRLEEWIHFHLLVGVQHVYVYDNSNNNGNTTTTTTDTALWDVTQKFPSNQVTYHKWPCQICNNNRPAHKNPGERSSQYAAEASCRERYGPLTEWMTFLDTDEYLVPLKANDKGDYTWHTILDDMDEQKMSILKFLSSRAKPRLDRME